MILSRRVFLASAFAAGVVGCTRGERGLPECTAWGSEGFRNGCFLRPRAIAVHGQEVYVIDTSGRVQVFDRGGAYQRGWELPEYKNGTPTAITFRKDGTVLIPDTHYSRLLEYTEGGVLLKQWGYFGTGKDAFVYPTGLDLDGEGNHYFSEYGEGAERIHVFDASGKFLRQWGEHGPEPGQVNRAMAIVVDDERQCLFVADTANQRVQRFGLAGKLEGVIGAGQIKYPHDLCLAPDGTLLVAEYGAHRISRWTAEGVRVQDYGRPGRGLGEFDGPRGVAAAEDGVVYVADTDNHRVQSFRIDLGGGRV